jgi:acyl-lipid omega-6 desaturase (Delta-12 desaturase)
LSGTKTGHSTELRQLAIELHTHCKAYMQANNGRAWWQVLSTTVPFIAVLAVMFWFANTHYWLTLLLAIPAGGLLVRFFAVQHDCGHGSFFSEKRTNERLGQLLSLITFTPYDDWRNSHATHHAGSGHLDRRGIGDIETKTTREFGAMSGLQKWRYRILRHPVVSLIIGPPVYFLILQRFPFMNMRERKAKLPANTLHNIGLCALYGALMWMFGWSLIVSVILPVVLMATWIGGWLFFVQHQFEETLWEGADKWDVKVAALLGSSHLKLHPILNWFSADIGLHHIHHLSSRIPNYRLRECLDASEKLQTIAPTLTLWQALKSNHLALWDEEQRRLISFGEYFRRAAKPVAVTSPTMDVPSVLGQTQPQWQE